MSEFIQTITPDIYQITIPVPFPRLRDINCYLLQNETGWTVVDTGANISTARAQWQTALETLAIPFAAINQIILTHTHPDHFGLAGWLQQQALADGAPQVRVQLSPRSLEIADFIWGPSQPDYARFDDFWSKAGLTPQAEHLWAKGMTAMRHMMQPYPQNMTALDLNQSLTIGQRRFDLIDTPGHSDGHIALYDTADQLMLIGDQVLMKITPNIGLWPGTEHDPLGRYLESLRELKQLPVRQALPGHGNLITQWVARITELEDHHAARLSEMQAAIGAGATAYQVSQQAFNYETLGAGEVQFAVTETLAHLEYLVTQQQLHRHENGVWLYLNAK